MLLFLLQLRLLDHSVVIFCILQQRQQFYKSECRSVRNEFHSSFMPLVLYICCYSYCSFDYQIILQLYFAFYSCDSSSIGHNTSLPYLPADHRKNNYKDFLYGLWADKVCQSVCLQQVLWKCYAVASVQLLLLLLLKFIIFEHCFVIFCILHFQLQTQLYRSQCQPIGLSVINKFYGSVMLLLMYDCCYCFAFYNI